MLNRRNFRNYGICHYHLCKKKTKVYLCLFCNNYFCQEHKNPKLPSSPPFKDKFKKSLYNKTIDNLQSYKNAKEWHEKGHPDVNYFDYIKLKEEEDLNKKRESLDKLKEISLKQPENIEERKIEHIESEYGEEIYIPIKKSSNKKILTGGVFVFLAIILIGLFISNQNPNILKDLSLNVTNLINNFTQNIENKTKNIVGTETPNINWNIPSLHDIKSLIDVSEPERKNECKDAFSKVNDIRKQKGRNSLKWDDRAYKLAVDRAKDMFERDYFDHVTPEGQCVKDFQSNYGFSSNENLAENAGGMSYYSKGNVAGTCYESVEGWMDSRGHRYNLLYPQHTGGAIGCYYEICVFLGINTEYYGFGYGPCSTGDEGLEYWKNAPLQPDES